MDCHSVNAVTDTVSGVLLHKSQTDGCIVTFGASVSEEEEDGRREGEGGEM